MPFPPAHPPLQRTVLIHYYWAPDDRSRFIEVSQELLPDIEAAFRQIGIEVEWKDMTSPWGAMADRETLVQILQELHAVLGMPYTPGQPTLPVLRAALTLLQELQRQALAVLGPIYSGIPTTEAPQGIRSSIHQEARHGPHA